MCSQLEKYSHSKKYLMSKSQIWQFNLHFFPPKAGGAQTAVLVYDTYTALAGLCQVLLTFTAPCIPPCFYCPIPAGERTRNSLCNIASLSQSQPASSFVTLQLKPTAL
jgi:hypothetical protein